MTWYTIAAIIALLLFIAYKSANRGPKKAAWKIGSAINVKPQHVEAMITKMGKEKGQGFVETINRQEDPETTKMGVKTFFIYQILKNSSRQNVEWWKNNLEENGFNSDLNMNDVEVAFMFLRNALSRETNSRDFIEDYKTHFS